MAEYKDVMVFGETADGKLAAITTELLGCGKKLASDLNQNLLIVLVGTGVSTVASEAIAYGADKVYVVDDPTLAEYQADAYLKVMEKVARQVMPRIIIVGQTSIGRDLTPRLAFRMKTTATLDCIELSIDPASKNLLQTKPVYGGNARAVYSTDLYPQMATLRAKAASPLVRNNTRTGEIINIAAELDGVAVRTKLVQKIKEETTGIKLEDAKIIISGGRGMGNADGFKQLEDLARVLKGAVGASRPPCDSKWVPDSVQIGLTGKIVTPELYIAIALSGSSQHMAGCSGAKTIVAINKDPEANIFKEARFGIVGDWKKVLPAFNSKVKELMAG